MSCYTSSSPKSLQVRKRKASVSPDTKVNALSMAQTASHQPSSIRRQHAYINNNNTRINTNHADTDSALIIGNLRSSSSSSTTYSSDAASSPYQQLKGEDEEDPLYECAVSSDNHVSSIESSQKQRHHNRGRQLPIEPQPEAQPKIQMKTKTQHNRDSSSLTRRSVYDEYSEVDNYNDDDKQHQPHNYKIVLRSTIPIVNPPPQSTLTVEDQDCCCNDHNSRPMSTNDALSCVSSLSVDESQYKVSHVISTVQDSPPVQMIYISSCHNDHDYNSEIHRIGDKEAGNIVRAPHHHQFLEHESSLRKSLSWGSGGVASHQLTYSTRNLDTLASETSIEKRSYTRIGIVSVSSSNTTLGKSSRSSRRRRAVKDEIKYLVGKMVPVPLRRIGLLTRTKSYDLTRSNGCLA